MILLLRLYFIFIPNLILPERTILINIASIQKLLRKALLYRIMTNVEKLVSNSGLSHQKISSSTGRKGNWFNDAYNNNEDIHLSSLSKILSVVNDHTEINQYQLTDIFDKKVLRLSSVMSSLADETEATINNFIISELDLFIDLLGDWGSLDSKNKLSSQEHTCFEELQKLIKQLANKGGKSNG